MDQHVEKGRLHIADRVIAKVASTAIQSTSEVLALLEGRTKRTDRNKFYKAVGIRINGVEVAITIHPIVRFGLPIQQISRALQLAVKQAVESFTGLIVSEVNINIAGIQYNI